MRKFRGIAESGLRIAETKMLRMDIRNRKSEDRRQKSEVGSQKVREVACYM